jgi:hypothetical protein
MPDSLENGAVGGGSDSRPAALRGRESEMCRLSGEAERRQSLLAVAFRHRVRHIVDGLCRLPDRHSRDDLVAERVDRRESVRVLKSNINPCAVPGRPDTARQLAYRKEDDILMKPRPPSQWAGRIK